MTKTQITAPRHTHLFTAGVMGLIMVAVLCMYLINRQTEATQVHAGAEISALY